MSVTFAQGFSAAGVAAGISAVEGKKDLALVVNNGPLDAAAGVFTSNRFCAAPVQWSRNIVSDGHVKAVILNSGGATHAPASRIRAVQATAEKVAGLIGAKAEDVAVCSTGLIGELLPLDNVLSGADKAFETLADTAEAGADASHAIMTTDTKPKTVELEGSNGFRIGGMVKGSGMIAPQLATMLCVITTDAVVTAGQLQAALNAGVEMSFNRIDVDGCMSTNDTVLLLASGASGIEPDPDEFNELVAKPPPRSPARSSATAKAQAMTSVSKLPARPPKKPLWHAAARSQRPICSNAPSPATIRTGAASSAPSAPCRPTSHHTIPKRSRWTSTAYASAKTAEPDATAPKWT